MNAVLFVAYSHRRKQTLRTSDEIAMRTVAFRVLNKVWIAVIEAEIFQAHVGLARIRRARRPPSRVHTIR